MKKSSRYMKFRPKYTNIEYLRRQMIQFFFELNSLIFWPIFSHGKSKSAKRQVAPLADHTLILMYIINMHNTALFYTFNQLLPMCS